MNRDPPASTILNRSDVYLAPSRRVLAPLLLVSFGLLAPAQIHKVDPQRAITLQVPGATAAYSLDSFVAEANAEHGLLSIAGLHPGSTHVVAITPSGVQTFEVLVTTPPPIYPSGFAMPVYGMDAAQNGYWEGRYYSAPAQVQSQFDFLKIDGDNRTHVHIVETNLLGALIDGQSRVALSSATYQIVTPRRDITLFDEYVDESQLTVNGSIVRGFHMNQDNWFVHAGYTSIATFDGLFLPFQPELVLGGGYRISLSTNSSITGSFYHLQIPRSDLMGRSGSIGDLKYRYSPREDFLLSADLGIGDGIAGSVRLQYKNDRTTILALARYMPVQFASLGANSLRGFHSDFSWARRITKQLGVTATFYNNNLVLPNLREETITGSANIRYQVTKHWAITSGALASSFQNKVPLSPAIRNLTLPAALSFQSRHFGADGQYQFAITPGRDSGSRQFRASISSGWRAFNMTAYAERDTNAPTLSFIFGQVAGLQQALNQQGVQATTVQQVDQLLSNDAYLIAAGYIKGATINLTPVRTQVGATAGWSSHGVHKRELTYGVLYNNNQMLQGSSEDIGQTFSYSQAITSRDDLSLACSVVGLRNPGSARDYSPVCMLAWRHQLKHVPYFIIPERRGTISGNVFRDDGSKGELEVGMPPMHEVEIMLDDRRHTLTDANGSYRFPNVPRGKHKISAIYHSHDSFFFTTPSDQEVDEDANVNFGIGYSLSGLMGRVTNDATLGVGGVSIVIQNRGNNWTAVTQADGSFFVSSLVAGDYDVRVDEDSLPSGYSADLLGGSQRIEVGAASPGRVVFKARALRSISGRVLNYDATVGKYVPVMGAQVVLLELGLDIITDSTGRFLFRDLPAGAYTLKVQNEPRTSPQAVRVSDQPADLTNVDFQIGPSSSPQPQVAEALSSIPSSLASNEKKPGSAEEEHPIITKSADTPAMDAHSGDRKRVITAAPVSQLPIAKQHNMRGRQLTSAHRYREAIIELNEAIRISPSFALALNARGFAFVMLREWSKALQDLDKAILLNSGYGNAYQIRAVARSATGNLGGAAEDLRTSQQLARRVGSGR